MKDRLRTVSLNNGTMNHLRKITLKIKVVLLIAIFASSAILLTSAGSKNFEITRNLDIFSTMFRELVVNYVDDINVSGMMKAGIDGMLSTLDPYTTFIPESEIEDVRFMTTGQYGGIGARIRPRDDRMMIVEPYKGFPAYKAGLLPGDIILEINGQSVKGRNEDEVRTLLQGQPGTSLSLVIERDGEPRNKSLEREVVRVDNIPYYGMLDENTAYIKLTGFTQRASREVREAFQELDQAHDVEAVVLDLRDNGGGLLHEAVNITNFFVEKDQLVVSTKGRLPERSTTHRTLNDPIDLNIPLAVLVNRRSASASEIVAGAIQDFDRGVVIGHRTFGKGLVQNVVPLSYNTQLKITVAEYFIPSGRSIQAINYAERHEDGSVAEIPDSLKTPHETHGGRKVYDGGGIEPDLTVTRPSPAHVTSSLIQQLMIFDFATHFQRHNDSIPAPEDFLISDDIYREFLEFIERNDFSYQTESENLLNELQQAANKEQYYDAIVDGLENLQQMIHQEKAQDLITFRREIEQLLREEIVSRYHYQQGRVIVSLAADPDVDKALNLLADRQSYHNILAGIE